ncbi:MAG: hypothetical protein E7343_05665 [Clostridiales bacterium]|nr:hypothetical protein [Clostridiales bacterium]
MKKKSLRILAGTLAVCFSFGASGCKSWFDKEEQEQEESLVATPEENAAFATVKSAYENSSNLWQTKGITMQEREWLCEKDETGERIQDTVYEYIESVDVANKIAFIQQDATGQNVYAKDIVKLFKQDGEYYNYQETTRSNGDNSEGYYTFSKYTPVATMPLEYVYENEMAFDISDVFRFRGAFLAKDLDTLKKGYAELSWEMSERQRERICGWSLERIEENLYKISKGQSVSFERFDTEEELKLALEKQKTTFENLKKEAEKIKVNVSVTAYEKSEYTIFELKNKMQSSSPQVDDFLGNLSMTMQLKAKDGEIVGYCELDEFEKWKNGKIISTGVKDVEISISDDFAQDWYDEIETVVTADTELEEVMDITLDKDLTLDIDGLSYPMEFEINSQTTVAELFTDWSKGIRFIGSFEETGENYKCVTWEDLYLDEAKTQRFNPANTTVEDFLKIEKLYTGFTVNDGYAVFVTSTYFFNVLAEKYKYLWMQNGESENPLEVQFEFRKLETGTSYHLGSISCVGAVLGEYGDDAEVYVNGQRVTDEDFEFEFEVKNKGYTKVKVIAYEKDWYDWWEYFQSFYLYDE